MTIYRLWVSLVILTILLFISVFFGCRKPTVSENFNVGSYSPAPNKISLSNYHSGAPSPAPAASPEEPVEEEEEQPTEEAEPEVVDEDMNSTEQELFEQITQNKITSEELEKLIKAGVVTDAMIQKFLSRIDSGDVVEPFCSGENTGCALE